MYNVVHTIELRDRIYQTNFEGERPFKTENTKKKYLFVLLVNMWSSCLHIVLRTYNITKTKKICLSTGSLNA